MNPFGTWGRSPDPIFGSGPIVTNIQADRGEFPTPGLALVPYTWSRDVPEAPALTTSQGPAMAMLTPTTAPSDSTIDPDPAGEVVFALASGEREKVIPVRTGDMTRLLLAEPGLSALEGTQLEQLGQMLRSVFHFEFLAKLEELKELYAPLDPDSDCLNLESFSRVRDEGSDEAFLTAFEAALVRANYHALEMKALEAAISAPNEQGLNFVPDFELFEHLKVYVRGNTRITRVARNLKSKFRKRIVVHEAYRRMVVILKFKPAPKLDKYARSDVVYLRLFKDVPHVDMEMHLPEQGTKVKMRLIDKAQIASPLATGIPTALFKLFFATITLSPWVLAPLLAGPITAGVNSFFGFQRAKQRHLHKMIRHLYYLNMATNASVITRIIDSAEEEEYKEALLAYFFLWRRASESWDRHRLDAQVEAFLLEKTGVSIDFEIGDALDKLTRLGLLRPDPTGRLQAIPIDRALVSLDKRWDHYFRFA